MERNGFLENLKKAEWYLKAYVSSNSHRPSQILLPFNLIFAER